MSDDDTFNLKITGLRNLDYDKKSKGQFYIKMKCEANGQSVKSSVFEAGATIDEPFQFIVSKKAKKGERVITIKLNAKGHVRDDCVGEYEIELSKIESGAVDEWIVLEKKKGGAELHLIARANDEASASGAQSLEALYTVGREVGRGGFSVVYEGTQKSTGMKVAIKMIDKKKQDGEQLVLLQREIDILKRLKHPNIITLYDVFDDPEHISLVLEFVSGGELYDEIVKRGSFTEADACNVLRQVLSATAYLHENGIAHRDLKPENLLIQNTDGLTVKIGDFGLSKDFSGADAMTTCCGSPSYVAPEVLQQGTYNNSCDIWSLGVILFVLLSGFLPFFGETQEELFDKILTGSFSFSNKVWDDISPAAKDLITQMLTLNEEDRPTAQQCLDHPWFKANNPRKQLRSLQSLRDLRITASARQ